MQTTDQAYFNASRAEMLEFVPTNVQRLLDVGCGAGVFGALVQRERAGCEVIGIEMNTAAAHEARARLKYVIEGAVELAFDELIPQKFDCIVFNDVLEHLVDPWSILARTRSLLSINGVVIASIPNVRYYPVARNYLMGKEWKYEKWGVLDKTHLRFFTEVSVQRLFTETGFRLNICRGIFPLSLSWKIKLLSWLARGLIDDVKFERFACVAVPDADFEKLTHQNVDEGQNQAIHLGTSHSSNS